MEACPLLGMNDSVPLQPVEGKNEDNAAHDQRCH